MKQRSTTPKKFVTRSVLIAAAVLMVAAGPMQMFAPPASADTYDDQIRALQQQVDGYNAQAQQLAAQADTLASAIAKLQNEQAQIQTEINLNKIKAADLAKQITENEKKLADQEDVLSNTLVDMYLDGRTTPIEVLAGSKSLGDYVDQQSQRATVRDQVSYSTKQIKILKKQLEDQKTEVERLIAQQKAQKEALAANQQQQQKLLDQTKGEEAAYQGLVQQNQQRIQELVAEREAYNRQHGGSDAIYNGACGGGYPFCDYTPDTYASQGGFTALGNVRECVNYVQWRLFQLTGENYLGGMYASDWLYSFSSYRLGQNNPQPNSVGVIYGIGGTGHVAWIERVEGNTVYFSEFNWTPFAYSERSADKSYFTDYLKFPGT